MRVGRVARLARGALVALAVVMGTVLPFGARPLLAREKSRVMDTEKTGNALRYDGKKELSRTDRLISLGMTGGILSGLMYWAWKENRKDDELELISVKKEVERLEKLKAEFLNVDEDGEVDDEDFFADLNKRIGKTDSESLGDGDEGQDEVYRTSGGTAVAGSADDHSSSSPSDDGTEATDQSARDMLKRMFDATEQREDDDEKKQK